MSLVRYWLFFTLAGCLVSQEAAACSFLPQSMLEKYTNNSTIFLGTVLDHPPKCGASCKDTYVIDIDEAFKFPNQKNLWPTGQLSENEHTTIEVPFNINGQCGFGPLKVGDKVLIFMNDGDTVSSPSGSWVIWPENKQTKAFLNPVWNDVLLIRAMLNRIPVPDADTAIHLALKAMIPVLGQDEVSKHMPFKATLMKNAKPLPVWKVEGTYVQCAKVSGTENLPCPSGTLSASVNQFSGEVEQVLSGD